MIKNTIKSVLSFILPKPAYSKISHAYSLCKYNFPVILRKANLVPFSKYRHLKRFRDIHKGERCFIVATGPSLTTDDLEKLKDEVTISMNSIVLSFEDTSWRPTYYAIVDKTAYIPLKKESDFDLSKVKGVFLGSSLAKHIRKSGDFFPHDYSVLPNYGYRQFVERTDDEREYIPSPYKIKFSGNISASVITNNIAYVVLQIAAYMGFSDIYLLGCDCNFELGKQNHLVEYDAPKHKLISSRISAVRENLMLSYRSAREYADAHGIKIYNATRGGYLEVFERVDLDVILTQPQLR